MASITLRTPHDSGVTVTAYPASNWNSWLRPPTGAPVGSSTTSATTGADGSVTLTGLADGTQYYAHTNVGGHRYIGFKTDATAVSSVQSTFNANVAGGPIKVIGRGDPLTRKAFLERAAMATSPTFTNGASGGASTLGGTAVTDAWTDSRFKILGASVAAGGPFSAFARPNNITGANLGNQPYAVEFDFYGDKFELLTSGNNGAYRLLVNDQYVTDATWKTPHTADGAIYRDLVDFTAAGGVALRRIRLEMTFTFTFGGITHSPIYTLFQSARPLLGGPRAIFLGDSFTEPTGATGWDGWANICGALLGWSDSWASGLGGTGYLNPGSPNKTFRGRVTDVTTPNPDVVIVAGGINDQTYPTVGTYNAANLQTEALALYDAILTALPKVRIVVLGPWWPKTSTSGSNIVSVRDTLQAAAAARSLPFIDTLGWITGSGKTTATVGDGNADVFIGSDGTHPVPAGQDYLGRRAAAALAPYFPLAS